MDKLKTSINMRLINEVRGLDEEQKIKDFLEDILLEENANLYRDINKNSLIDRYKKLVEIAQNKK